MDIRTLEQHFPELSFKQNESLAPYTFMKVGGEAEVFVEVKKREDLFALCAFCFQQKLAFRVLGGASNVLVPDAGLSGLAIRNLTDSIKIGEVVDGKCLVTVDSGATTAVVANEAIKHNLTGLECFIGVPGTIGGAIVNNSHFSLKELIGDFVESVEVCTIDGKREVWGKDQLDFAYDYSVFHKRKDVVLSVTFTLEVGDPEEIQVGVRAAALKRASTQPIGIPSSGCMYRNPQIDPTVFQKLQAEIDIPQGAYHDIENNRIQIAAGFLIDRAGLKGKTVGGAQVSEKHATYIINLGQATSSDVEALCLLVEATVKAKFAITLEREVFFLS